MFPNIPKRTIAIIQVWVSLLLVVLALVMSFLPIVKINTAGDFKDNLNEFLTEEGANIDLDEIPDEVSVTAPKLISSIFFFTDIASAVMNDNEPTESTDDGKYFDEQYYNSNNDYNSYNDNRYSSYAYDYNTGYNNDYNNSYNNDYTYGEVITDNEDKVGSSTNQDIVKILEDEANREDLITAFAFISVFSDDFNEESSSDDILSMIFNMMTSMISLMYILVMTLILPIILLVKAIITLVVALKNLKTPENATAKVSSKLTGLLSILFMIILFQCALPQISYGAGAIAMLIITITSIVLNAVAVRLPAYRKEDMMYANIVQGISLVGILGFLLFFFNLIKTGILTMFLKGPFFVFVRGFKDVLKSNPTAESSYTVDAILMILYVAFAIVAVSYIAQATRRFSLSAKGGAHLLAYPILALPVFILPTVIMSSQNLNVTIAGQDVITPSSSLILTDSQNTALTLVLVGIIVMLLAEIAYIVLPKILCKNMTKEERHLVLAGKAPDPNAPVETVADETVADENATAEEAPAEEAATTEEAPAEETAEEAAPAEEAAEEAAPAEEAAEDTQAE